VGNNLHRLAQITTGTLVSDNLSINAAVHQRAGAAEFFVEKALVMAQIEVGLGAVVGHEDLAVLRRVQGSSIGIQVRIALLNVDAKTAGLKDVP